MAINTQFRIRCDGQICMCKQNDNTRVKIYRWLISSWLRYPDAASQLIGRGRLISGREELDSKTLIRNESSTELLVISTKLRQRLTHPICLHEFSIIEHLWNSRQMSQEYVPLCAMELSFTSEFGSHHTTAFACSMDRGANMKATTAPRHFSKTLLRHVGTWRHTL